VVLNFPRNKFGGITESIGYVRLRFSRDSIFDDLLRRRWFRLGWILTNLTYTHVRGAN